MQYSLSDPGFAASSFRLSWLCLAAGHPGHCRIDICHCWDLWCSPTEGQIPINCKYVLL